MLINHLLVEDIKYNFQHKSNVLIFPQIFFLNEFSVIIECIVITLEYQLRNNFNVN